eukprot:350082-Alexandrium_andersonii.AAC.1
MRAALRHVDARLAHPEPSNLLRPQLPCLVLQTAIRAPPHQRMSSCPLLSRGSSGALASLAMCDPIH